MSEQPTRGTGTAQDAQPYRTIPAWLSRRRAIGRFPSENVEIVSDTMTPLTGVGALLFVVVALSQGFFDDTPGSSWSTGMAVVTAAALGVLWVLLRGPRGPALRRHPVRLAVTAVALVGLNPLVYILGTQITYPAIGMLMVIVGIGALLYDRFWAIVAIVAVDVAWILCAVVFGLPVEPAIFAAQLVKANALAIVLMVARARTFGRLEAARREVHRLATTDELTGVANQRGLLEAGRVMLERATPGERLTVVFVDVDGLKVVNDAHGHAAGDQLIRSVADVLRRTFRPQDTVARLGGDEFAIIVGASSEELAQDLVARVQERLEQAQVSASLGTATSVAGETDVDLDALLEEADTAMYTAKLARKSRTRLRSAPPPGGSWPPAMTGTDRPWPTAGLGG
ncbi:GGDEF domain-containing protein [Nakamurella flava]|uniref:GGDEF domain-containing protein n=1 Tax=Nakamurella flava TaxID=2576308 RepID=A0A4V6CR49_9ACTN|nr:GGDEF domain-containing protein [Nakamurella flava]TKV55975.1 GGDEF domain-containing protein [Nakamurella flava]